MGKPVNPVWDQQDYAFYESNGTTIIGTAGTQQTLTTDTTYYVRIAVGDTNNSNQAVGLTLNWQYNLAGGGWNEITDTSPIQHANGSLTDGGSITSSTLTAIGTFNNGRVYESENTAATVYTTPGDETDSYTEVMLGVTIDSAQVTDGQEILVRVTLGDGTGITWTVNADIDVDKPATVYTRSSTLAGAGSVTASASNIHGRTSTIAGAATVSATQDTFYSGVSTISGAGSVSATSTNYHQRTSTIAADGDVTANATQIFVRQSTIAADGDVTATQNTFYSAAATVAAAATVSATYTIFIARTATIAGAATVSATQDTFYSGVSTIAGVGAITAAYTQIYQRAGTIAGAGNVTATQNTFYSRSATIAGTGAITTAFDTFYSRAATIAGAGTLSAIADTFYSGVSTIAGAGDVTTAFLKFFSRSATAAASGSVSVTATVTRPRTSTIAADGDVNSTRTIIVPAIQRTATIAADGDVSATRVIEKPRSATVAASGSVSATATVTAIGSAVAGANGYVNATPTIIRARVATVVASATTSAILTKLRASAIAATTTVSATSGVYDQTRAILQYVNEVWIRLGLDRDNPITITQGGISGGGIEKTLNGDGETTNTVTRINGPVAPRSNGDLMYEAVTKMREIWQVMGLDPNNAMTLAVGSITVGEIQQTITGDSVNTSVLSRTDANDHLDINAAGDDLLINDQFKIKLRSF